MNKKEKDLFRKWVLIISVSAWIMAWAILAFQLDLITYVGFILYGLGISGISIYFSLKAMELTKKTGGKDGYK